MRKYTSAVISLMRNCGRRVYERGILLSYPSHTNKPKRDTSVPVVVQFCTRHDRGLLFHCVGYSATSRQRKCSRCVHNKASSTWFRRLLLVATQEPVPVSSGTKLVHVKVKCDRQQWRTADSREDSFHMSRQNLTYGSGVTDNGVSVQTNELYYFIINIINYYSVFVCSTFQNKCHPKE